MWLYPAVFLILRKPKQTLLYLDHHFCTCSFQHSLKWISKLTTVRTFVNKRDYQKCDLQTGDSSISVPARFSLGHVVTDNVICDMDMWRCIVMGNNTFYKINKVIWNRKILSTDFDLLLCHINCQTVFSLINRFEVSVMFSNR